MISVAILINGQPIATRSAVNVGQPKSEIETGMCWYRVDDGNMILHQTSDGAVALAIEMLKMIKEVGVEK